MTFTKLIRFGERCVKIFCIFLVILGAGLCFSGQTVYAATGYNDTEPNNSYEDAQLISRNAQTATQYVSGQSTVYRYVMGTLSYDDEDWYKVYLYSNSETYLDFNVGTGTIFVELYDSSNPNVPVDRYEFQKYGDTDVYEIPVVSDGLYYLRVYHSTIGISSTYNFTIGNPKYEFGNYTYKFKQTTLAAKSTWEDTEDLTRIAEIPDRAIGYEIVIGGCSISVSSERYFYNVSYDSWVATNITHSYKLPVTDASLLDQEWGAKIVSTSSSSHTFTPTMTIRYVAPKLP